MKGLALSRSVDRVSFGENEAITRMRYIVLPDIRLFVLYSGVICIRRSSVYKLSASFCDI